MKRNCTASRAPSCTGVPIWSLCCSWWESFCRFSARVDGAEITRTNGNKKRLRERSLFFCPFEGLRALDVEGNRRHGFRAVESIESICSVGKQSQAASLFHCSGDAFLLSDAQFRNAGGSDFATIADEASEADGIFVVKNVIPRIFLTVLAARTFFHVMNPFKTDALYTIECGCQQVSFSL